MNQQILAQYQNHGINQLEVLILAEQMKGVFQTLADFTAVQESIFDIASEEFYDCFIQILAEKIEAFTKTLNETAILTQPITYADIEELILKVVAEDFLQKLSLVYENSQEIYEKIENDIQAREMGAQVLKALGNMALDHVEMSDTQHFMSKGMMNGAKKLYTSGLAQSVFEEYNQVHLPQYKQTVSGIIQHYQNYVETEFEKILNYRFGTNVIQFAEIHQMLACYETQVAEMSQQANVNAADYARVLVEYPFSTQLKVTYLQQQVPLQDKTHVLETIIEQSYGLREYFEYREQLVVEMIQVINAENATLQQTFHDTSEQVQAILANITLRSEQGQLTRVEQNQVFLQALTQFALTDYEALNQFNIQDANYGYLRFVQTEFTQRVMAVYQQFLAEVLTTSEVATWNEAIQAFAATYDFVKPVRAQAELAVYEQVANQLTVEAQCTYLNFIVAENTYHGEQQQTLVAHATKLYETFLFTSLQTTTRTELIPTLNQFVAENPCLHMLDKCAVEFAYYEREKVQLEREVVLNLFFILFDESNEKQLEHKRAKLVKSLKKFYAKSVKRDFEQLAESEFTTTIETLFPCLTQAFKVQTLINFYDEKQVATDSLAKKCHQIAYLEAVMHLTPEQVQAEREAFSVNLHEHVVENQKTLAGLDVKNEQVKAKLLANGYLCQVIAQACLPLFKKQLATLEACYAELAAVLQAEIPHYEWILSEVMAYVITLRTDQTFAQTAFSLAPKYNLKAAVVGGAARKRIYRYYLTELVTDILSKTQDPQNVRQQIQAADYQAWDAVERLEIEYELFEACPTVEQYTEVVQAAPIETKCRLYELFIENNTHRTFASLMEAATTFCTFLALDRTQVHEKLALIELRYYGVMLDQQLSTFADQYDTTPMNQRMNVDHLPHPNQQQTEHALKQIAKHTLSHNEKKHLVTMLKICTQVDCDQFEALEERLFGFCLTFMARAERQVITEKNLFAYLTTQNYEFMPLADNQTAKQAWVNTYLNTRLVNLKNMIHTAQLEKKMKKINVKLQYDEYILAFFDNKGMIFREGYALFTNKRVISFGNNGDAQWTLNYEAVETIVLDRSQLLLQINKTHALSISKMEPNMSNFFHYFVNLLVYNMKLAATYLDYFIVEYDAQTTEWVHKTELEKFKKYPEVEKLRMRPTNETTMQGYRAFVQWDGVFVKNRALCFDFAAPAPVQSHEQQMIQPTAVEEELYHVAIEGENIGMFSLSQARTLVLEAKLHVHVEAYGWLAQEEFLQADISYAKTYLVKNTKMHFGHLAVDEIKALMQQKQVYLWKPGYDEWQEAEKILANV